jgi:hypothetical protein
MIFQEFVIFGCYLPPRTPLGAQNPIFGEKKFSLIPAGQNPTKLPKQHDDDRKIYKKVSGYRN